MIAGFAAGFAPGPDARMSATGRARALSDLHLGDPRVYLDARLLAPMFEQPHAWAMPDNAIALVIASIALPLVLA